jgi:hypothetical protein
MSSVRFGTKPRNQARVDRQRETERLDREADRSEYERHFA